jgi:hypothetical protein
MKNSIIWVVLLAGVVTTFSACEEEPDPVPIIVGTWERDIYQFSDLPATFQNYEGFTLQSVFGDESYTLTFNQDLTYTRKIAFVGPDVNDTGTWLHEGDDLTLDSNDADIENDEFEVEDEITSNQLVLSQILAFNLLPDVVTDTLTNEWADANQEELDQYYELVDVKVLFLFEK